VTEPANDPNHPRREGYDPHDRDDDAPRARVHLPKSPWLWIIPAIVVLFVGWMVVRYGFFGGGDITVRFAEARGLDRYSPVRFRGAKVGTVKKITIDKDLSQVVVRISMDASMSHALKKGTRFWIVEPSIEGGGLGGILSGTYVGIAPGDGPDTSDYIGQEYPPVLSSPEPGRRFLLEGQGAGAIAVGSPVQFEGIRVGRVLGSEYDEARGTTTVHIFVVNRFANQVRETTRFWRGGGFSVSLGGGGLSMGDSSLASLLNAPVAFTTPTVMAGRVAPEGTRFNLFDSRSAAEAAAGGPAVAYRTYFAGPVHGLTAGTPVQMKGVEVGRVRDVQLRYVAATGTLETPVTFAIDPRRLGFPVDASTTAEGLRRSMNDAMATLVAKGMRASLVTSLVLPGASAVSLDLVAKPGTAHLVLNNDPPIVPAAAGGSGLEGAMSAISDVAGTIRSLPLQEIAGHMSSAAKGIDSLVNDPKLHESVDRMNRALADVQQVAATAKQNVGPIATSLRNAAGSAEAVTATAKENIGPLVESLRNAAASAEAAAKRAEQLVGTSQRQGYDLGELIRELTRAAQAVRALASYLDENPDALLKGRAK
jgi:paraquat-inducible protein B